IELRHDAIAQLLVGERPREKDDETEQVEDRISELRTEPPQALLPLLHHFVPFAGAAEPAGAAVLATTLRSNADTPISTGPYESGSPARFRMLSRVTATGYSLRSIDSRNFTIGAMPPFFSWMIVWRSTYCLPWFTGSRSVFCVICTLALFAFCSRKPPSSG